jgi:hypothetical protein
MPQFVSEGFLLSSRKAASVDDRCLLLTSLTLAQVHPVQTATGSSLPAVHPPAACIQKIKMQLKFPHPSEQYTFLLLTIQAKCHLTQN